MAYDFHNVLDGKKHLVILDKVKEGKTNCTKISKDLEESRSEASKYLNLLQEIGLLDRKKDGRSVNYSLTEKGKNYLKQASELQNQLDELKKQLINNDG